MNDLWIRSKEARERCYDQLADIERAIGTSEWAHVVETCAQIDAWVVTLGSTPATDGARRWLAWIANLADVAGKGQSAPDLTLRAQRLTKDVRRLIDAAHGGPSGAGE